MFLLFVEGDVCVMFTNKEYYLKIKTVTSAKWEKETKQMTSAIRGSMS